MKGIQFLLLTFAAIICLYFIIRLHKRVVDILVLSAMVTIAVIFVIWPDLTNTIASYLGVGRGADMVFYVSIFIFWFIIIRLFDRIRHLERMITEIIRKDAIETAKTPKSRS